MPRRNTLRLIAVLALAGGGGCCMPAAHAEDAWQYEIEPYLWAAGIDGHEGVGNLTVPVSASFDTLFHFVNIGASMRVTARRDAVEWYGEGSYVQLGDDTSGPLGTAHVQSTQILAEGGMSYSLLDSLAVYAGVRYQDISGVLASGGFRRDADRGWVDGLGGVKWTPLRSAHWSAWLRGDVGGGSSKLTWLTEVGTGYAWNSRWAAYLAYRILSTDYEGGNLRYDVRQSGLFLGFGIRL